MTLSTVVRSPLLPAMARLSDEERLLRDECDGYATGKPLDRTQSDCEDHSNI